jgi:hypothetical protein
MEPSDDRKLEDDRELDRVLQQWQAPGAPLSLRARVLPQPSHWWQWLATGTIRIPVPVGIAVLLAAAALLYFRTYLPTEERPTVAQPAKSVSLADFQPVKQLEPRVIGRANEGN